MKTRTVSTYVDVDVSDILDELTDEDLLEELAARRKSTRKEQSLPAVGDLLATFLFDIRHALYRNNVAEALALVEAEMSACMRDPESIRQAYDAIIAGKVQ